VGLQYLGYQGVEERRRSATSPDQAGDPYGRLQRWGDALRQYNEGAKVHSSQRVTDLDLERIADFWLAQ